MQVALVTMQTTRDVIAEREAATDAELAALSDNARTLHAQSPTLLQPAIAAVQGVGSGVVANIFTEVLRQQGLDGCKNGLWSSYPFA